MTLDGFSTLPFVRPEVVIKKKDFTLPLSPHSPIRAFTQGHLRKKLIITRPPH